MVKVLVLGARPEVAKFFFFRRQLGGLNNTFLFVSVGFWFIISPTMIATMMMCCVGIVV